MTTESKLRPDKPFGEWTHQELSAERRRNRQRWLREMRDIRERFPNHWIAIYDAGETVIGHEDAQAHYDHLYQLTGVNHSCVFRWPPPLKPNTAIARGSIVRLAQ